MNATPASAHTGLSSPLPLRASPSAPAHAASPRLPVWDERARKMGYPPSAR